MVRTEDDYVNKAMELASDIPSLASLRMSLRERMLKSHLCDGPNFVRGLEENYRTLWLQYCDGVSPSERCEKAEAEELVGQSVSTTEDVTDMQMKEAGSALSPNTMTVTPTPSPTSTLSTTEGNSLGETGAKCIKRSPSSLGQSS